MRTRSATALFKSMRGEGKETEMTAVGKLISLVSEMNTGKNKNKNKKKQENKRKEMGERHTTKGTGGHVGEEASDVETQVVVFYGRGVCRVVCHFYRYALNK